MKHVASFVMAESAHCPTPVGTHVVLFVANVMYMLSSVVSHLAHPVRAFRASDFKILPQFYTEATVDLQLDSTKRVAAWPSSARLFSLPLLLLYITP